LEVSGAATFYGPFNGPTVTVANPNIAAGASTEDPVTPRLVLTYQPDRDNMIYASAAKGYRGGGINPILPTTCGSSLQSLGLATVPTAFNQDSLWSYELGSKNTLFDRRLQLDASVFYIDWKGIQQNVYLLSCGVQYTANLGVARSLGGDVHVQVKPAEKLLVEFTAAYTDAKYTQAICAGSAACTGAGAPATPLVSKGDRLPGAPWSFTFSTEYGLPLFHGRDPYVRLDYHYTTAQTALLPVQNPSNGIADPTLPGLPKTSTLALRAGVRWSGIDVSLYAQNLTNSHPLLFESRDITNENLYFARSTRPRTIGLTASYRY
jgi:outer membrane receptor protein involved in Fe transport